MNKISLGFFCLLFMFEAVCIKWFRNNRSFVEVDSFYFQGNKNKTISNFIGKILPISINSQNKSNYSISSCTSTDPSINVTKEKKVFVST